MAIQSQNPTSGTVFKSYSAYNNEKIESILAAANREFHEWKQSSLNARTVLVRRLADTLEKTAEIYAKIMTNEMGKTLNSSHAEINKCIQFCRYTADIADKYLCDECIQSEYKKAFTRPLPLGTILLVMPWNFPFWQVIRVAVPVLLSGNTCLLKHASNVPGCALALEKLFLLAGFPRGAFQTLLVESGKVTQIIEDERIHGASLTGSEYAGSQVAAVCGKQIKKCVLELGGSDPFIVMPSADIGEAINAAFTSGMRNNGQSCIAAKRLIIHDDIYEKFKVGLAKRINKMVIGDPHDPKTDLGPLSSTKAFDEAEKILCTAISAGARSLASNHTLPKRGYYMRPGLVEGVTKDMALYSQEIFAPVAMLFKVSSLSEAITLANDIPFGLSSVLFSNDVAEQDRAIAELESGSTYINRYASSDIRLPFGGIKCSGFGREMAREGLLEFTNLKTIIVAS